MNTSKPVEFTMTIASITTAVEYWMSNVVFREAAKIDDVSFDSNQNLFTIKLKKDPNTPE
ncbi:MAG: hypothetical protein O7D95_02980 [Betaproteobacteria bacterium]|nr:hypothetical protein [Betaproteobacteria bacterium]